MAIDTTPVPGRFHMTSVTVRPIESAEEARWNELMDAVHPLGNVHFPGHRIKYVAEVHGHAVALACFSGCAYHLADRDRNIGWTLEQAMQRRHLVVQNSRFLILSDRKRRNLASRVLAGCARRIERDWLARFGFSPLMLESFVDPVHFQGTCYKAAGWQQVGSTRGFRRDGREFYCRDSHPKQIWLKALHPQARTLLCAQQLPPPWCDWETALPAKRVAARLGTDGLSSLFESLQSLPDCRRTNGRQYPIGCCLAVVIGAFLGGCKTIEECAEFAASLTQHQLRILQSWKNPKTGRRQAPRATTLWRVLSSVDPKLFEERVKAWATDLDMPLEAIAIDGKALRATSENADGGSFAVNALNHRGSTPFFFRSSPTAKGRNSPAQAGCLSA